MHEVPREQISKWNSDALVPEAYHDPHRHSRMG